MKRFLAVLISVLFLFLLAGCGSRIEKTIQVTAFEEILYCGDKVQLAAIVKAGEEDVSEKTEVTWTSSNPDVASVDDSGNIKGISGGSATITAALLEDKTVSDEINITVGVHVSSISFADTEMVLLTGSEMADAKLEYQIFPEEAFCKDVSIQSSDEDIVTVDDEGNIHAISAGTATISVTSLDKTYTDVATCVVTVKQGVNEITLSEDAVDFYFGDELTLTAQVLPENADNQSVVWTSSDETVAIVSQDGVITAVDSGKTDIICTAQDGSGASATCTLTVVNPVEKLELSESKMLLLVGSSTEMGKKQIACAVLPENATYQNIIWTSSDEGVAVVDEYGIVTGVDSGKTTITARTTDPKFAEKISVSCSVTVGNAVQGIEFADVETSIAKGTTKKIKASIIPESAYNSKVVWTSSDENILKVDANGNVRAVNVGTAKITCTATDGSGVYKEESFTVYQPVTGLKAEETGNIMLFEGNDITLHATAAPADATNKDVEWTSDNPDVASVDASGCVTGEGKGTAIITATAKDGSGKKCTFRVYVEPALPITVESLGFGTYNGNLLGITVKNHCSKLAIRNFDFDIELESYFGTELDASGSYSLGDNVFIGAGSTQTIKRTLSGVSWTQKVKITITGVEFTDGTYYYIPWLEQETCSFYR